MLIGRWASEVVSSKNKGETGLSTRTRQLRILTAFCAVGSIVVSAWWAWQLHVHLKKMLDFDDAYMFWRYGLMLCLPAPGGVPRTADRRPAGPTLVYDPVVFTKAAGQESGTKQ